MATIAEKTICGATILHDNSGVGHNWRKISAAEINADTREEIAAEILDGGVENCDDWIASNGLHYAWTTPGRDRSDDDDDDE